MLDSLDLPSLSKDFSIVVDLKCMLILLGLQSASSIHNCPYCTGYKVNKDGNKNKRKGNWAKGTPRNLKNLEEIFFQWSTETNSDRALLKKYFNSEYPPVRIMTDQLSSELEVELIYPIRELHVVLLGPVNDTIKNIKKPFQG